MALYIGLVMGVAELLMLEIVYSGKERMFGEYGLLQVVQSLFLLASAVILWVVSRSNPDYRELCVCLALVFTVLLIRENDQNFELWLVHGFWKWPALAVLLFLAGYFARFRRAVAEQLEGFARTLPFGILVVAMSLLLYSRLYGGSRFWEALLTDGYDYLAKAAAEEGTELLALSLVLAFAIETYWLIGRRERRRALPERAG